MAPVRIAVAGAGAVVETFHLPASRLCPEIRVVALADKNVQRARALAARFGIPRVVGDYRELGPEADGVLIALPNVLHASAAIHFLAQGTPVLVEKPMALGLAEAEEMVRTARTNSTVLAAGLVGRIASGARWLKRAVTEGQLGPLKSFEVEYGIRFAWQPASSFLFKKEQAGGGVLIDLGSHMLDLAIWWMGKPTLMEYRDDSMGGLEAECRVILSFATPSGPVVGAVCLSRLRTLANTVRVVGEGRAVDWDIATDSVHVRSGAGHPERVPSIFPPPPRQTLLEMFAEQLRVFARAAAGLGDAAASGESVLTVVELVERCYRERRPMGLPWMKPVLSV